MAFSSTNWRGRLLVAGTLAAAVATTVGLTTREHERMNWFHEAFTAVTGWRLRPLHAACNLRGEIGERHVVIRSWRYPGSGPNLEPGTQAVVVGDRRMLVLGGAHAYRILDATATWRRGATGEEEARYAAAADLRQQRWRVPYEQHMDSIRERSGLAVRDARHTNLDRTVALFARERYASQACPPAVWWDTSWPYKLAAEVGVCSGLVDPSAPPDPVLTARR